MALPCNPWASEEGEAGFGYMCLLPLFLIGIRNLVRSPRGRGENLSAIVPLVEEGSFHIHSAACPRSCQGKALPSGCRLLGRSTATSCSGLDMYLGRMWVSCAMALPIFEVTVSVLG